MKRTYAVFGLGTFGSRVATELAASGNTVVAVDVDPDLVDSIKDKVAEAVIANVTNPETIAQLVVRKFDAVIIGLSSHFEDMILALTLLKQEGAGRVIVKANSDMQRRILLRLGADEVIQPDIDVAERLCNRLRLGNMIDMIEFKGSYIAEVKVPESMNGKTLRELDMRNRHNITVMLFKKPGRPLETIQDPDMALATGDQMTVFGDDKAIMQVFKG